MKIAKKNIVNSSVKTDVKANETVVETNKYTESISYIESAIHSLGAVAKDDEIARDAIANLSVVLFDLKGQ